MKIKKIISVLTTTAILATSLPMQVFAEDTSEPVKNGDRLTIEQLWGNFIEEYDDDHDYKDWMYYLVKETNRYNREGFKSLTSSRVIPMSSIIEALAILDNEKLDFNNPI